jgi:mRNA interferase MazF
MSRAPTLLGRPAAPSAASYNGNVGPAALCPITNRLKRYPFEVPLSAGLPVTAAILSDHVKSFDWRARDAQLTCALPDNIVSQALEKLGTLL